MKLQENNIIVKRKYKTVYRCDDSIVKCLQRHIRSQMYLMKRF